MVIMMSNDLIKTVIFSMLLFAITACEQKRDQPERISLFPLNHYDQTISTWINPRDKDFDKNLMSADVQRQHMDKLFNHLFAKYSPWNKAYVQHILAEPLAPTEKWVLKQFNNQDTSHRLIYGENFRVYPDQWINNLTDAVNLPQFEKQSYQKNQRAIAVDNVQARLLPTDDVAFYDYKIAGEGYPFDNLQMSAVWVGTPLYVLGQTKNHAWSLVLTPDFIAWVKTTGLAYVNDSFVQQWIITSKKSMATITQTDTSIMDKQGHFLYTTYVGTIFPAEQSKQTIRILVPIKNTQQQAQIIHTNISEKQGVIMPIPLTARHVTQVMQTLLGRPYGWGNQYFYNDCSAELKNFYTAFGIWLPRHSSDQVYAGNVYDATALNPEQRLAYLQKNGHPFLTLIYIGSHIFMYIGNNNNMNRPMLYQAMWGLQPASNQRRAVIGQSVLFPLLLQYPEDTALVSQAAKKYFQVSNLDEFPNLYVKITEMDLHELMSP